MGKSGPKLTPEQRAAISDQAWRLRVTRGLSQRQIAAEISRVMKVTVDRSTISRVLASVRSRTIKSLDKLAEQTLAEQAEQTDYIYNLALANWRQEKNPQDLQVALAAMKHKADILHLKVIRLEHTGKDGGPIDVTDARERLAQLLARQAGHFQPDGGAEPTE